MKDAYYFPHYVGARNDRKLMRLRLKHGLQGYGIYFCLLEILREQTEHKYPFSDMDLLCADLRIEEDIIRSIISDFGLFKADKNEFWSPKLMEYLEPFYIKKENAIKAGKKSAKVRNSQTNLNDRSTHVQQAFNTGSTINKESNKVSKEEPSSFLQSILKDFPDVKPEYTLRGEGLIPIRTTKAMILSICKRNGAGQDEARWYYNKLDDVGFFSKRGFPMTVAEMVEDLTDLFRRKWVKKMTEKEFKELNG